MWLASDKSILSKGSEMRAQLSFWRNCKEASGPVSQQHKGGRETR